MNSDFHSHLGSSTPLRTIFEIAYKHGIRLNGINNYIEFIELMSTNERVKHQQYLNKFDVIHEVQSSPLAMEESMFAAVTHAYLNNNIDYLELRFNPMKRNGRHNQFDIDEVIKRAIRGMNDAMNLYPIQVGIILETDTSFSSQQSEIIFGKAIKYMNDGVVAVDISGSPDKFKVTDHKKAYDMASESGLKCTAHAGEMNGAEEVWEVINQYKLDRIGHGIQAYTDMKLLRRLAGSGIVLEVCPTSNVMTKCVSSYAEMITILHKFYNNGVMFTINTDGPFFLNTNIQNEFKLLEEHGLSDEAKQWAIQCVDIGKFIQG